jgi:hypothetical protein
VTDRTSERTGVGPLRRTKEAAIMSAALVLIGAVAAWLAVDRLWSLRNERLQRGSSASSEFGPNRTFHSTGWEETIPPLETTDLALEARKRRAGDRAAA